MDIIDIDESDRTGETLAFVVGANEAGKRLDLVAAQVAKERNVVLSRTRVKNLIEAGWLLLDGAPVLDGNHKLKLGDAVAITLPEAEDPEPMGEAMPLSVVYEDAQLIVIDKPAGLVVHPAPGHSSGTLVNGLIAHCGESLSGIGGVKRPGIVHRLDKDTSGLLVVAKTDAAHHGLAKLFADHGRRLPLLRTYLAFVWGNPGRAAGTVEAAIGRHPSDRLRMAVVPDERGRAAITHWRLKERFDAEASLLACTLETGRTHQIRAHMAHIGHPVLGDPVYARGYQTKAGKLLPEAHRQLDALGRQALHASILGFRHPTTGAMLEFESPLPNDLAKLASALRGSAAPS